MVALAWYLLALGIVILSAVYLPPILGAMGVLVGATLGGAVCWFKATAAETNSSLDRGK